MTKQSEDGFLRTVTALTVNERRQLAERRAYGAALIRGFFGGSFGEESGRCRSSFFTLNGEILIEWIDPKTGGGDT